MNFVELFSLHLNGAPAFVVSLLSANGLKTVIQYGKQNPLQTNHLTKKKQTRINLKVPLILLLRVLLCSTFFHF